jgi:hypothetical protein
MGDILVAAFSTVFLSAASLVVLGLVFGKDRLAAGLIVASTFVLSTLEEMGRRVSKALAVLLLGVDDARLEKEFRRLNEKVDELVDGHNVAADEIDLLCRRVEEIERSAEALTTQVAEVAGPF